jgi:surface protein
MTEELKVNFQYQGNKIIIQCRGDEKMKDIAGRFKTKIGLNSNDLIFLCHGTNLNLESTFNEEIKDEDKKNNEINVVVEKNDNSLDNNETIKSKNIICPICKENCRMCIINYKIILFECKNGHKTNNILLEEFDNKQQINEYYITCDDCDHENKGSSYNHKFFKCLTCKKKLGILCKEKHRKEEHKIIEYDKKDYICEIHNDYFYSYCQDCRLNLCMNCYFDHKDHNIFEYQIIIPIKEKVNEDLVELRNKIDQIDQFMKEVNEKFKIVKEKLEKFYQINCDIYNNYNLQDKNYQILKNINEINNNIKLSNIDKIINEKKTSIKIVEILNAYEKMVTKEENHDIIQKEEIGNKIGEKKKEKDKKEKELLKTDFKRLRTISVCPNTEQKVKSFPGKNFETNAVEKPKKPSNKKINDFQKNKAKRQSAKEIESSIKKLKEDEKLGPNEIILEYKKGTLKDKIIKIFGEKFVSNNRNNCSIKFDDKTLELKEKLELPKNYKNEENLKIKLIANNLTDMSYMFHECTVLTSIGNNSTLDTSNVTNMSYMFYNCNSLTNLSCISKWITSNVKDISYMFYSCSSLKKLPDISNWDTAKVTTLDNLFEYCTSLSSLPDISKWNISNVTTINYLFADCQSLISLPDISKWNTSNVTHMNYTFSSCEQLKSLPDISSWDISNVEFKYNMFGGCTNLKNIPSKFK